MNNIDRQFVEASYEELKQYNEMMEEMAVKYAQREQEAKDRTEYLAKYYEL